MDLNTFRAFGDDFVYRKQPQIAIFSIFKYFLRSLQMRLDTFRAFPIGA